MPKGSSLKEQGGTGFAKAFEGAESSTGFAIDISEIVVARTQWSNEAAVFPSGGASSLLSRLPAAVRVLFISSPVWFLKLFVPGAGAAGCYRAA